MTKVYEPCPICKGTGKIPKMKKIRVKCSECQDHNHGCWGSGRKDGYGYDHCVESEYIEK